MKKIEFRAGSTLEQCYAKIKSEAIRSGEVVCGEFNGTLMRSDAPLAEFYRNTTRSATRMSQALVPTIS